jgi:hypothetical protein
MLKSKREERKNNPRQHPTATPGAHFDALRSALARFYPEILAFFGIKGMFLCFKGMFLYKFPRKHIFHFFKPDFSDRSEVKKAENLSPAEVKKALILKQEGFLSTPIAFLSHAIRLYSTSLCLGVIA